MIHTQCLVLFKSALTLKIYFYNFYLKKKQPFVHLFVTIFTIPSCWVFSHILLLAVEIYIEEETKRI
jgi:hypothetical protein